MSCAADCQGRRDLQFHRPYSSCIVHLVRGTAYSDYWTVISYSSDAIVTWRRTDARESGTEAAKVLGIQAPERHRTGLLWRERPLIVEYSFRAGVVTSLACCTLEARHAGVHLEWTSQGLLLH
uniref:Uncharacterized protein n=1 Tax=Physcomitrium patens TaxID=3218 RepID=A0A2K1JY64_PHYPA|nr:hypothetical protein PHYPA_013586 [Physcomitrium patens]